MSNSNCQKLPDVQKAETESSEDLIVSNAWKQLEKHDHFRQHGESIDIDCKEGKLVLIGRLPSFYLKQVLQTILRGLPGVRRIDNRVDVISPTGLSSVRKRTPQKGRPA